MLLLDITVVNVALPDIQKELDTSFTDLQWVVDAYALTLATTLLTAGSLGDRMGRKRVFLLSIAIFTAASALCGAAQSPLWLILAITFSLCCSSACDLLTLMARKRTRQQWEYLLARPLPVSSRIST